MPVLYRGSAVPKGKGQENDFFFAIISKTDPGNKPGFNSLETK